jgi:uncharacterized protein (DUF2267 family)
MVPDNVLNPQRSRLAFGVQRVKERIMSTLTFYRRVIDETGETNREVVKRGTAAVFHALRDRITPEEAEQAVAQLPRDLKRLWEEGDEPGRKPVKLNRREFYDRVKLEAQLASIREARLLTLGVFAALKAQLSPGEGDDIWAQLPRDLKEVWEAA